jgi:C4-type Zn-finger protein
MVFTCPTCMYTRNDIPPTKEIGPLGTKLTLKVTEARDLARKFVLSERATFEVTAADIEFPASNKFGMMNTLGGFIERAVLDLELNQSQRQVSLRCFK